MHTEPVHLYVKSNGRRYTYTPVVGDPNQVIERSQIAPQEPGDIVVTDMVGLENWRIENYLMEPRSLAETGLAKVWRGFKLDRAIPAACKIMGFTGSGPSEGPLFKIHDPRYKAEK